MHEMHRNRTHGIIYPKTVKHQNKQDNRDAGNCSNQSRTGRVDKVRWGSNRDKAGKATVQRHANVWFAQK